MQTIIIFLFKIFKRLKAITFTPLDKIGTIIIFYGNSVKFANFQTNGIPKVNINLKGKCRIGPNFRMNNREMSNPIGRFNRCSIIVGEQGHLIIGSNVGMSSTAIVCHNAIKIGNNVNIGGNVVIYDTDFHSLNAAHRLDGNLDRKNTVTKEVIICDNAFIGAHSTILKGVTIGENSIIGACSLVSKNVPSNEIWGGNPAKFIKSV
jgi:acetyltransferase-like isoleucine patch superfamily enzyme